MNFLPLQPSCSCTERYIEPVFWCTDVTLFCSKGKDTFTIQHEGTGKCLQVQQGSLMLGECSEEPAYLWKWGSNHRLFLTGLSACLAMDVPSKTLSLTSCSPGLMFEWHCSEGSIYTVYQMRLGATTNGTVLAKRDASDSWIRGGTSENICQQPYQSKRLLTFT